MSYCGDSIALQIALDAEYYVDDDEPIIHDFDPSGDEHPPACMCPCCDLAEDRM